MSNYVLVHGAWHGGWCWKRVSPLLQASGHQVFSPTLTGLGERAHLISENVGLETHIKDVLAVLEFEDLRDVVLVGHSFAGMVITGVAEKAAERISHLVYLDAFVPENGKSLADYQPPEIWRLFQEKSHEQGDGFKLPLVFPLEAFGVTKEDDVNWVRPRLTPHPLKTKSDPVFVSDPNAARIPRTYIYCSAPAVGVFDQFADRLRQNASWRYVDLATGHDAMVTAPQELAKLLLECAT